MWSSRPMIGRTQEALRLVEGCALDRDGSGVAVLSGDAGIGKTRLLKHLAERAQAQGRLVVVGHCVAQTGAAMPYLPFVELLAALVAAEPAAVAEVAEVHPALLRLLPGSPTGSAPGRGAESAGVLAEAVHACLNRVGAARPLLVVIEDVHWADHSSRDLVTLLLTRGFTSTVALVVSYRSDDLHRRHPLYATVPVWARLSAVTRVELPPLPDADVRALLRTLPRSGDDQTLAAIAARAAGNAFFAEELAASGAAISEDLSRVLQVRFEDLDLPAQSVLKQAALGGLRVRHDLLAAVSGLPPDELDAALRAAVEHHLLELSGDDGYAFRHALLAEAICDQLLPGEAARIHARYTAAIAADPALASPSELARHAAASGDRRTAVRAGREAGESALRIGGPREALDHFEAVLTLLPEDDPEADEVALLATQAASAAGDWLRAAKLAASRVDLPGAERRPDLPRLLSAYVVHSRLGGLRDDQLTRAERAVRLTVGRQDAARLEALTADIQALVDRERWAEASEVGDEALDLAQRLAAADSTTNLRVILARAIDFGGDPELIEAHLAAIVADAPWGSAAQVRALHRLAELDQDLGRLASAQARFDEGAEVGRRFGRAWAPVEFSCRVRGGLIAYELGDFDGALSRLRDEGEGPDVSRALLAGARLPVLAARDLHVPGQLFELAEKWWGVDAQVVLVSFQPQADLLSRQGRRGEAVAIVERAAAEIERQWDPEEAAFIRLAAVRLGLLADQATTASPAARLRYLAAADLWLGRAGNAQGWGGLPLGPEGRAWQLRLAAEDARLRWRVDGSDSPVEAWRAAVAAFEAYGHRYETARTRLRLAEALFASGEAAAAREQADLVRVAASALPSEPLAAELDALVARSRVRAPTELTPRELEVLRLVARGHSNGEIGRQLVISTKTASVHVSNLLAKLGAASRGEAVAIARDRELLA